MQITLATTDTTELNIAKILARIPKILTLMAIN